MSTQPEAILEEKLIQQLAGMGYTRQPITDELGLRDNLKNQLEQFNETLFSPKEFSAILNHLAKGNVFQKAKTLRDRFQLNRDNGDCFYVRFFNSEHPQQNRFQVTSQVTQVGVYKNRYDVTVLVNGLPLLQIELKKRGIELKEAFNQINRYQGHSFWTNYGLFQYVQIFVISNGVNTKYFANNRKQSFKQTFFWAEKDNRKIAELTAFATHFLNTRHLGHMLANYIVHNETHKILMVLRPYQYWATESLINHVRGKKGNGYIWHTTGSGKTLTAFKASQIIMDLPGVFKVVFVVDRKDLDYQTMTEFNSFKLDCVDFTSNTKSLVKQLKDDTKLIVTTIQKLNNAIKEGHSYARELGFLRDKRMVFIFDECHRSQFGETHKRITRFFQNSQLFGFTGTPIFAENAQTVVDEAQNLKVKRTTKDLFQECLHKYVITNAIADQNVLRFSIEYIGRYRKKGRTVMDIQVEDINTAEVFTDPQRLEKIVDYIIAYHDLKTHQRDFTAIFAVSSIDALIGYYELFQRKKAAGEHDLRIATIFSYGANDDSYAANDMMADEPEAAQPQFGEMPMAADARENYGPAPHREKLDEFIADYNAMYGTGFSTRDSKQFENYYKDISGRIKNREKESFKNKDRVDILLVVNMFLTGFDAKKVSTLYVDKKLRYHGLIQAFSRTNRTLGEQKSHGNILCFRNLKAATDEAIALFSNINAKEEILMPSYENLVREFADAFADLLKIAPTVQSVDDLISEDDQLKFVQAFRRLMRLRNVLITYADFSWADLPMSEQLFADYAGKYLDLKDKVKSDHTKEKASILEDIDFELELIHRDDVNVAYILKLLAKLKQAELRDFEQQKAAIMSLLGGEVELRSKRELIEQFIEKNLPMIDDVETIPDEFEKYWQDQKVLALGTLCEEEKLDQEQFKALIEAYIFSGQEPLRDEVLDCLGNRPSVLQSRVIGMRIIERMKEYVDVFVRGLAA